MDKDGGRELFRSESSFGGWGDVEEEKTSSHERFFLGELEFDTENLAAVVTSGLTGAKSPVLGRRRFKMRKNVRK